MFHGMLFILLKKINLEFFRVPFDLQNQWCAKKKKKKKDKGEKKL